MAREGKGNREKGKDESGRRERKGKGEREHGKDERGRRR
jgi:hypothetical protein